MELPTVSPRDAGYTSGAKYLPGTTFTPVPPPTGKQILLIDDDPFFRSLFKVMLVQSGLPLASVLESEDAASGVSICRQHDADIVFCDLNLSRLWPGNGIGVVYDIRRMRPRLPVYMVTADNASDVIEKVVQSGATGHLLKPLNLRVLKRVLMTTFPSLSQDW